MVTSPGEFIITQYGGETQFLPGLESVVQPTTPTSKVGQCKNGGWRNFPQFKNQGQCIAFVNHGP